MDFVRPRIDGTGTRARIRRAALAATEMLEPRRLLSAGDLDPSFGVAGKVVTDLAFPYGGVARHAVVVQTDGKIVAVGETTGTGNADFAVLRFNPDGSPDPTFGDGGTVTTDFSPADSARGVAVQPDGKIVVAGIATVSSVEKFVVARYNADGSPDTSFSTDGFDFAPFSADALANAVTIQSDGKIVVAGAESNVPPAVGSGSNVALARYNADGTLDATFGSAGLVSTFDPAMPTAGFSANAVAVQSDGAIVVGGMADNRAMLARVDSSGTIDTSFGVAGWVTNFNGRIFGVAVQPDGKVVWGGYLFISPTDVAVGRQNINGSPDNSFSGDAIEVTNLGSSTDRATGIALQPDGKVVASAIGPGGNGYVLRYGTGGSLDTTFSGDGIAQLPGAANAVALQVDGRIVVAGTEGNAFRVARLTTPAHWTVRSTATASSPASSQVRATTPPATSRCSSPMASSSSWDRPRAPRWAR